MFLLREQGGTAGSESNVDMKAIYPIDDCTAIKLDNCSTNKQMSVASTSDIITDSCVAYGIAQLATSVNAQNPIEEDYVYAVISS